MRLGERAALVGVLDVADPVDRDLHLLEILPELERRRMGWSPGS